MTFNVINVINAPARWPGLPIPTVSDIGRAFDGWFAISTRAYGTPLEQLSADEWNTTQPSLFAVLDELRRVDIAETTGFGIWGNDGNAPFETWRAYLASVEQDTPDQRKHGWKTKMRADRSAQATFEKAFPIMIECIDAYSGDRSIVHNDLLNRNALAHEGNVSALFDWGCSIYGDFLYELAAIVFWSPYHKCLRDADVAAAAKKHFAAIGLAVPDFETRLRCYALHIGLEHLAYNSFTGIEEHIRVTERYMEPFL